MRRLLIAILVSLAGIAACDVDINIRRGETAAFDAGTLAESPDPSPVAAPGVSETKPAPKDKSLKRKADDLWNRVKHGGKELARDAEKRGEELLKDADGLVKDAKNVDVDVDVKKKDLSPTSWIAKIPWLGWVLIALIALVVIGGILDALDIFEGFFESLGKLLAMLIEVLVKAALALAKGFVSLIAAIGKAFRPKRKMGPGKHAILIDGTTSSGGTVLPQRSPRERGDPESWSGPTRRSTYHGPDDTEQLPRRAATAKGALSAPPRDEPGPGNGVIEVVGGVVEAVGETLGEIADAAGDIDIDLD